MGQTLHNIRLQSFDTHDYYDIIFHAEFEIFESFRQRLIQSSETCNDVIIGSRYL